MYGRSGVAGWGNGLIISVLCFCPPLEFLVHRLHDMTSAGFFFLLVVGIGYWLVGWLVGWLVWKDGNIQSSKTASAGHQLHNYVIAKDNVRSKVT